MNPQDIEIKEKLNKVVTTNIFKRSILSLVMIGSFSYLISLGQLPLSIFVIILGLLVNKEIVDISRIGDVFPTNKWIVLGLSHLIFIYCVFDSLIYCIPTLSKVIPYTKSIFFYSYLIFFMFFVIGLTNGRLKSQFGVFALAHLGSYFCGVASRSGVRNISNGNFWLVFPSSLVICNDIMAYIVGKSFGKRPLYRLSPKKTVEGFIGGFIGTAIFGFLFCYFELKFGLLTNNYNQEMSKPFNFNAYGHSFSIPCIYLHSIPFILVASFIAPFSGFLASALKRAYKKKDFGQSIPGHGGLADRFDCQIIIALFTSIYIKSFLKTKEQSLFTTYNYITSNYNEEEIKMLIEQLKDYLK
jgi:phosphatidate cytidylyltransferase